MDLFASGDGFDEDMDLASFFGAWVRLGFCFFSEVGQGSLMRR